MRVIRYPHGSFASMTLNAVLREVSLEKVVRISMDGRGAWRDSVFVERLWKPIGLPVYPPEPH